MQNKTNEELLEDFYYAYENYLFYLDDKNDNIRWWSAEGERRAFKDYNDIKQEISNNIINLIDSLKNNPKGNISKTLTNNILSMTLIWTLGISIIGIPIVIIYYLTKLLTYTLEIIFLIINHKLISILFIPIYSIPYIINIMIYFILTYYSIAFSLILIKHLFMKKSYNIKEITKKYIKLYFILLIGIIMNSLIEIYVIPNILKFF